MSKTKKLLEKPIWNYRDIMSYTGFKKSKVYEIMGDCKKKYGGGIREEPSYVKRDSVLAYLDTTIRRELEVIKELGGK